VLLRTRFSRRPRRPCRPNASVAPPLWARRRRLRRAPCLLRELVRAGLAGAEALRARRGLAGEALIACALRGAICAQEHRPRFRVEKRACVGMPRWSAFRLPASTLSARKTVIGIVLCGSAWDALLVGCAVGGRVRCASEESCGHPCVSYQPRRHPQRARCTHSRARYSCSDASAQCSSVVCVRGIGFEWKRRTVVIVAYCARLKYTSCLCRLRGLAAVMTCMAMSDGYQNDRHTHVGYL